MFKKISAIILALIMTVSLYGCSSGTASNDSSVPDSSSQPETQLSEADLEECVDAYNLVLNETFGASVDEGSAYMRLYKDGNSSDLLKPDAMIISTDLKDNGGVQQGGDYDGYTIDPSYADCYKVTNFDSLDAVREYLGQWLENSVYEERLQENFMEYDGALYLVRGGRGYGTEKIDTVAITAQTADSVSATAKYYVFDEDSGVMDLIFSVTDGKPVMTSAAIEGTTGGAEDLSADQNDLITLLGDVSAYESGTAGASLKAFSTGVELLNFASKNLLTDDEIKTAAEYYENGLTADELSTFFSNFDEIRSACDVLWTDQAQDMIDSAGVTDALESYDKTMAENFFAIIGGNG